VSTWDIVGVVAAVYALFLVMLACWWNPRFQHVRREDEMVSRRIREFAAAETLNPEPITADPQPRGGTGTAQRDTDHPEASS